MKNVHTLSRITVAFVWIYHGVIPKIIFKQQSGEIALSLKMGVPPAYQDTLMLVAALLEILLGVAVLVWWRSKWPFQVSIAAMVVLFLGIVIHSPIHLVYAFNPVSLNLAVMALAAIGIMTIPDK